VTPLQRPQQSVCQQRSEGNLVQQNRFTLEQGWGKF